jgi:hypothetical protein
VALAEFVLRLFDPEVVFVKSFDDKLLFSMYPDRNGTVISEEYKVSVSTNTFGGRQILSSDHYPILLMGDSFSEGWGVEEPETFTAQANELLPSNLKIMNMGVHGSCPSLMYIHLTNYIDLFKPKKVYIQLFDNDLDDLDKLEVFMNTSDGIPTPKKPFVSKLISTSLYNFIKESSIFRLGKRAIKYTKGGNEPILYYKDGRAPKIEILDHKQTLAKYGNLKAIGKDISIKYNGQFEFYTNSNPVIWSDRLKKEYHYLNLIFDLLRKNDIQLGIIYIPAKEFFAKDGILGDEKFSNLKVFESKNPHYSNIKNFCDSKAISCLLGTNLLWDENPEDLYFPYDAHWNRKGHEVFGKIFANEIQKSFRMTP